MRPRRVRFSACCFSLVRREDDRCVAMVTFVDLVVTLTYALIVCDLFCISVTEGAGRCKGLQAVKTAKGRVGEVIFERKFRLSEVTVPVKVLTNTVTKCILIPRN